jgi:hypothetical protein
MHVSLSVSELIARNLRQLSGSSPAFSALPPSDKFQSATKLCKFTSIVRRRKRESKLHPCHCQWSENQDTIGLEEATLAASVICNNTVNETRIQLFRFHRMTDIIHTSQISNADNFI